MTAGQSDNGSEEPTIEQHNIPATSAYISGGGGYDQVVMLESWQVRIEPDGRISHTFFGHKANGEPFAYKGRQGYMSVLPMGDRTLIESDDMPTILLHNA